MSDSDKERLIEQIDKVELVKADGPGPKGWVYFIVCADTYRCKIGFTQHSVEKRLKNLQTGSPGELSCVVMQPGTTTTEAKLHQKFAASRVRGEWFDLTDELRAYMVVVLWAMSEVTIRDGRRLEPWMTLGCELTLKNLGVLSESLIDALESAPS